MLTELELQSQLVKAIKDLGGFGYKQSNKFLAGPPDLYLSHPDTGPVFVEVKLNQPNHKVVLVTPLQELTMKRMQEAGSKCGICVLVPLPNAIGGGYDIYMTRHADKKKLDDTWRVFTKHRGQQWPMFDIMEACDALPHTDLGQGVVY